MVSLVPLGGRLRFPGGFMGRGRRAFRLPAGGMLLPFLMLHLALLGLLLLALLLFTLGLLRLLFLLRLLLLLSLLLLILLLFVLGQLLTLLLLLLFLLRLLLLLGLLGLLLLLLLLFVLGQLLTLFLLLSLLLLLFLLLFTLRVLFPLRMLLIGLLRRCGLPCLSGRGLCGLLEALAHGRVAWLVLVVLLAYHLLLLGLRIASSAVLSLVRRQRGGSRRVAAIPLVPATMVL